MFALLADPKFLVTVITLACQLVGQLGVHADPIALTTALSPLYLYVLAKAHSESGNATPLPPVAPGAKPSSPSSGSSGAGAVALLALVIVGLSAIPIAACSGPQKQAEVADVKCGAAEINATIAILDDKTTNGAAKLLALGAIAATTKACIDASKPPPATATAGSGSAL